MSATEQFVAQIAIFPFNFAPTGWAFCDGQILPLSQNTALFSLLGTTYGGNGESNFALPDFQGRVPIHPGQGPGLSLRDLGEFGGEDSVTLLESELPAHTHSVTVKIPAGGTANTDSPLNAFPATFADGAQLDGKSALFYTQPTDPNLIQMATITADISTFPAGASLPHSNIQPTLFLNFCIALQGVFPPRT
ncbi:phage tail protein [Algoriphagus lacus]|uniref:Phage tail protein n=1 Tax=Algoriphagus lacus TaxID=2056311 RepID=A0A418PMP3_9BACT|nr:tail fiber protein [Algoriphagus lacus]RIW12978.1 phage tail protein [Algoriphagus lacus]